MMKREGFFSETVRGILLPYEADEPCEEIVGGFGNQFEPAAQAVIIPEGSL